MRVGKSIALAAALVALGWNGAAQAASATGNLQVKIQIQNQCLVNAGTGSGGDAVLDFGTHSLLTADVERETAGDGAIRVQCTSGTSYTIGLGAGENSDGDINGRRMKSSAGDFIAYQLYKSSSRAAPWGDTGGDTVSATGNGNIQSFQVFGRVPGGQIPPAGIYTDNVAITITY
jgi:spore coat protein U-like protein